MHQAVIDFDKPIALFPLDSCILLPHATVPLHIYEDRYIQMIRDRLDSSGLIATATFAGDGQKQPCDGKPPIRQYVCIGYIARHELLSRGRYNILLQGLCRARIVEEVDHQPYRLAMLEPSESAEAMEIDMDTHRQQLDELLEDPLLKQLASVGAIGNWTSQEIPTAVMVDLAVLIMCCDVEDRYTILAEPDPEARAAWLIGYLRKTKEIMQMAQRQKPAQADSGVMLN